MFGKNKILKPEKGDGSSLQVQEIFATFQGEGPFVGYPSVFVRLGGCNLACDFCDTEFDSFQEFSLDKILEKAQELSEQNLSEKDFFVRQELKKMNIILPPEIENWFEQKRKRNLVVITGGEPLRQPIELLCEELIARDFLVQIETNGTLFRNLPSEVKIICSPKISPKNIAQNYNFESEKNSLKLPNSPNFQSSSNFPNVLKNYHKIRPDLLARINALKFIISASKQEYQGFTDVGQKEFEKKTGKKIPIYFQPMDEYDEQKNLANVELARFLAQKNNAFVSLQIHKILRIS